MINGYGFVTVALTRDPPVQVNAGAAFSALVNTLVIALVALVPGASLSVAAIALSAAELCSTTGLGILLHREHAHRFRPGQAALLAVQFALYTLTGTEQADACLVAEGLNNKHVAARVYISTHTAAHHLRQAFRKLSITSRVGLTRVVIEHAADGGQPGNWPS